ncbi:MULTISPECIES: hypothetical protein [Gammaproteobacteria]|uniref:hypothetical protein n=1 Tax=Gammaproteobacteria TaxID=1236 RepID=UPI00352566C6
MAIGWSKDGMVQEQIENSIDDAIALVRNKLHSNSQSLSFCEECDAPIPQRQEDGQLKVYGYA